MTIQQIVAQNIAAGLQYPKIEKTVPHYHTESEYGCLLVHFTDRSYSAMGLKNQIIIMLLSTLGLQTATLIAISVAKFEIK